MFVHFLTQGPCVSNFSLPLPLSLVDDKIIAKLSNTTWLDVRRQDENIYTDKNGKILNYTNIQPAHKYGVPGPISLNQYLG